MARKRPVKTQPPGKWRIIMFFLFLFTSLFVIVSLVAPPLHFMKTTGAYLGDYLGLLVVFVPVILFITGSFVLRLNFAEKWLRRIGAVFVSTFFFSTMLSLILCRIRPDYLYLAGGQLTGRVVLAAQGLVGGLLSWVALFSLFMISVVIFTGWDISGDINAILGRRKSKVTEKKHKEATAGKKEKLEPVSEPAQSRGETVNPWTSQMPFNAPVVEFPNKYPQDKKIVPIEAAIPMPTFDNRESEEEPVHFDTLFKETTPAPAPVHEEPPVSVPDAPKVELPVKTEVTQKPPLDFTEKVEKVKAAPVKKEVTESGTKKAKAGSDIDTGDLYELPGADFLSLPADGERHGQSPAEIQDRANLLVSKLADFGVECSVAATCPGPVLTRYELTPGVGVKVNRILALSDDLALALAAKRIRILAPIPGKGAVGIEVPNKHPETVYLREIISKFKNEKIPVALGKRLEGQPFIVDLTDMPHLLIAGATGSGKSVCVHAIISTILLTRSPYQVKFAMVDPKMLELSAYKGIPHLWAPVVVQTSKARYLLEALVKEMEERYALLARTGVRSITEYNKRFGPDQTDEHLPYIVVVIDELADLMMVSARDVEPSIARLAAMARAVGIHLVIATQRPSVDVLTGVIKSNFPSRIAFNVSSGTDSKVILDKIGAEKLLGKGDMLFVPAASPEPIRVHGSFISTEETKALVDFWREQPEIPFEYEPPDDEHGNLYDPGVLDFDDPILDEVKRVIIAQQRASVSMVQRKFRVGYARAGKLIDMLEQMGVVGPHVGSKPRDVLVKPEPVEGIDES